MNVKHILGLVFVFTLLASALTFVQVSTSQPAPQNHKSICQVIPRLRQAYERSRQRIMRYAEEHDKKAVIEEYISKADQLAQEARTLYESDNCAEAAKKIREAFAQLKVAVKNLGLGGDIKRKIVASIINLKRAAQQLESIVERLENASIPVSVIKDLIESANKKLDIAKELLQEGKLREAAQAIKEAQEDLDKAYHALRELLSKIRSLRLERMAKQFVERVNVILDKLARHNSTLCNELKEKIEPLLSAFQKAVNEHQWGKARALAVQIVRFLKTARTKT
ncbi:MAG TPA: hypothetical protein ENJ59_03090 [Thermofilum sp.]|nr:hypothetical protein [Thermofilum sp.]